MKASRDGRLFHAGPVLISVAVVAALVVALHAPVLTRGALIAPAGAQYGQWPWKAYAAETEAHGAPGSGGDASMDALLLRAWPWQLYTARSLEGGWIPLWNPYSGCGTPFVANAQSAVFFPLHWPAWIFPSMRVFTAAMLMKVVLAGGFMAIFLAGLGCRTASCVTGSVSFALCGFMTGWLGSPHTNAALLLPLVMHATRSLAARQSSGPFLLLVFAGAAQYLGGDRGTTLQILGLSALYFLWSLREAPRPRLAVGMYLGAMALACAMAAVQLLPSLEREAAGEASTRAASVASSASGASHMTLSLLLPGHVGRTPAGYAGAAALLLALVSLCWWRRTRFFVAIAVVSAVSASGPPGTRWAPGLLLPFCLATLAALGLAGLEALEAVGQNAKPSAGMQWRQRGSLIGVTLLCAFLLIAVAMGYGTRDPNAARLAAFFVGGTGLLVTLVLLRPSGRAIYTFGIAAITCVDMLQFASGRNPHAGAEAMFPPTRLTDFLRKDASADMVRGGRLLTVGPVLRAETQMPYWLSSIEGGPVSDGLEATESRDYRRILDMARVDHVHQTGEIPAGSRPLLDLLGMRYVVTPPQAVVSGDGLQLAYDGPDGRVFVNDRARPRLSFVSHAASSPAESRDGLLESLAAGRIDLDRQAVIESTPAPESGGDAPAAPPAIALERNIPGALAVVLRGAGAPGYLVVGDAWDAGWEASVNGKPAPVRRANYLYMAVDVPAGDAEVLLTYRPRWFRTGAWVSAISLMFAITIGLVSFAVGRSPDLNATRGL
ncbi:MAG TPA: YfhO family protein [Patescibacteria group bacterium]|nr:YfhO family protein [Patescibacteria group bacterium]